MGTKKADKSSNPVAGGIGAVKSRGAKWGGNVKQIHVPSGAKLIMKEDSDAILIYIGEKDISDKCIDKETKQAKPAGSVVYQTFHDGQRFVSMPNSYSIAETTFTPDKFYYIHVVNLIPMQGDFNDMKDFEIFELGSEGETVKVDADRIGKPELTLTLEAIAEVNYSRLNYPMRKEPKGKL